MTHQIFDSIPNPRQYSDWRDWAGMLVQRMIEFSSHPEENASDLLLAATGVAGFSSASFSFLTWTSRLLASKLYFHASGTDRITFAQRGSYVVAADLNFTATALANLDSRVYVSGVDMGDLCRARAEGTNFIKCPILGAFIQVSKDDYLQLAVQGSATNILTGVSRLWIRKL